MDDLVAPIGIDVQRRRQRIAIGHGEWRAVRKHTSRAADTDLADRQEVTLQLQLVEPPWMRTQRGRAQFDIALRVAVLLLHVLRSKEQSLAPYHLVEHGHRAAPSLLKRASWSS